jgi:hypothetical protein
MLETLLDLLFCPQDSVIYGSRYGILRPENWCVIQPLIQPILTFFVVAWYRLKTFLKRVLFHCWKKVAK